MNDTAALQISLHGVVLELRSGSRAFHDYVAAAMAPYLVTDAAPQIVSRLDWVEGRPSKSPGEAFALKTWERRPDRDLYLNPGSAYWLRVEDFTDLQIAAHWDGALTVQGRYHFALGSGGWLDRLRRLRWATDLERLRARRFSTLLYYLVYYPILWWLSRMQGWNVLHGGAVARAGRAVVFGGMPGCGKSTIAVSMLSDPDVRMLSDNLVLYNDTHVRACPELLLLDDLSLGAVGAAAARLTPTGERRVFERDAYRPAEVCLDATIPAAVCPVERGADTACVPLAAAEAQRALLAGNTMAKEVRRLVIFGEVLDLVAEQPVPDAALSLSHLLTLAPAYSLRAARGDTAGAASHAARLLNAAAGDRAR